MLVTAKLSRKFYDKLGEDVANELVDWLNQMDAAYRSEFRDLFEIQFARFDARLEQRSAEVKAELRTEFRDGVARLETRFANLESRLVKWLFLFWATSLGALIALQKL